MIFTVPGKPVPFARVFVGNDGKCHVPAEMRAYKRHVAAYALQARCRMPDGWSLDERYDVEIHVYRVSPAGRRRAGDIDGYAKTLLDALNKVVWVDDSQVRRLEVEILDTEPGGERVTIAVAPRKAA